MKPILACLLLLAPVARGQIFADVSTTMGDFTIQLDHLNSPRTVASFLRLAEGSAPWIDQASGIVHYNTPYYEGITFHRVIAGFMNQTGSRNGLGNDGPGYTFKDEVDNGLTHSGPYIASMANSGPNTNGSQIFITVRATPELNGKHTVFGNVTTGQDVCDLINAVTTDGNDKPLTDVSINSVTIRREGGVMFDEHAQMLPTISAPSVTVQYDAGSTILNFPQPPRSHAFCYHSPDLADWSPVERFLDAEAAPADTLDQSAETAGQARQFFATSVVMNPLDAIFPGSMDNRTLTTTLIEDPAGTDYGEVTFQFNASGGGTYVYGTGSGIITSYDYTADGYGGRLLVFTDGLIPLRFRLGLDQFDPLRIEGRHTGTMYFSDGFGGYDPVSSKGTFTLTR